MMDRALFIAISVLLVALATPPAFAGSKKKKAAAAPPYQAPVIASVTGNTITVSEEKTARTFIITQFTEINVNGQRAAIADLKPGRQASLVRLSFARGLPSNRQARCLSAETAWKAILHKQKRPVRFFQTGRLRGKLFRIRAPRPLDLE